MGSLTNELTVQTLVESGCLSTSLFLTNEEQSLDNSGISGQAQRHDAGDRDECNSPLQTLNAVKLSLMVTRAFTQCYEIRKNASLGLDDFMVKLQYPAIAGEADWETPNSGARGGLLTISTASEFNAITAADGNQWILLDVNVKYLDARFPSEHANIAAVMQSLGKLLLAIFSPNNDAQALQAPETRDSSKGVDEKEISQHGSKMRRSASESQFQHFIELGFPVSICRLLSDLIDRDKRVDRATISFDDVTHDLEQMISLPHIFLYDSGSEFHTSTDLFGRKLYGRSGEVAKFLEITTVPKKGSVGLEVIFVSGMAGSGKTHLVSSVGTFVSGFGFMVLRAKFNRRMEHNSTEIVSTLMDDMVSNIVQMKENGNDSDVDYSNRVAQAISTGLDADGLSTLADFIPSIQSLVPDVANKQNLGCTHRQLIFLLSTLLCSVLSQERKIIIALDDLQWADPTTFGLISAVLSSVCRCPEKVQRLVFVGMYREDEVSDDLALFITSFVNPKGGINAHVTDMQLSALSLNDVTEMIMSELRLPRRLVSELAVVVHKRTHGHALFVVQLLNSLVSDSTITYSFMRHRFYWDRSKVCNLKTADNVASLLVANLALLPAGERQCLRIISCFGIQVQSSLLEILEVFSLAPQGGFKFYLHSLADRGILEISPAMVVFTHDLIQQQVYEGIPMEERRQLHCDIGIFLASQISLDVRCEDKPMDAAVDQLFLNDVRDNGDNSMDVSPLISFATSQINNAGPEFFSDRTQHTRFARWNLHAGKDAVEHSSFGAALYYYKSGIAFLGDDLWLEDTYETCLKLNEGAAFSSSALGKNSQISIYTNDIINNAKVKDSLVAEYLLIGSLSASGKYKEAVARGLAVLRQLKFDIPATPSPGMIMEAMHQAENETSLYNSSQISDHQLGVGSNTRKILKLINTISVACYHIASPFLPLVACATIRYSLQHGVCEESAAAFITYAYFQVFLKQSFESGRQWVVFVTTLLEKSSKGTVTSRASFLLYAMVNFWYVPLQESSNHMQEVEDMNFKFGDTENAYMAQCVRYKFLFFRGEQLSTFSRKLETSLPLMARFSIGSARFSALDKEMIDALTGDKSSNPYAAFNGKLRNKQAILAEAQSTMNSQTIEAVYIQNFFISFWMGDYDKALEASDTAMSFPSAKMPKVALIYHIFYRGIAAFHLYREGNGEKWLKEGNDMKDQMEVWVKNSKVLFENKLLLLEAEYCASMCEVILAKESYKFSIKVARDNGYVHEQGLAYECMGKYLMSAVEVQEAECCLLSAHKCYMQWGATAKANKLWKDWNLGSSTESIEPCTAKHQRDECFPS